MFFNHPAGFDRWFRAPVGIVFHKEGVPDGPGQPHDQGLQQNQQRGIGTQPPENTAVVNRKTNEYPPGDEGGNREGHGERITHIAGTVIKTDFYFSALIAGRAAFVHFHKTFAVGIFMYKHIAGAAPGTFIAKYCRKVVHVFIKM